MSVFRNLPKVSFSPPGTLHVSELRAVIMSSAVKSAIFSILTGSVIAVVVAVGDNVAAHSEVIFASPVAAAAFAMVWNMIRGALNAANSGPDQPVNL